MSSTTAIEGKYFSYDGATVSFFGMAGRKVDDRKWLFTFPEGDTIESDPDSTRRQIARCVERQFANGRGSKVFFILMSPLQAVVDFLDGGINPGKLDRAIDNEDGFVDIPGIRVAGKTVTIRVSPDIKNITAADCNGEKLPT